MDVTARKTKSQGIHRFPFTFALFNEKDWAYF
jgi:hypothetical protein